MKYSYPTKRSEILGVHSKDEEQAALKEMREKLDEKEQELWEKERAKRGFFRTVDVPSQEALDLIIEEELEFIRHHLKKATYNPTTQRYEVDPEQYEEENRFQKIARLGDHCYYSDERTRSCGSLGNGLKHLESHGTTAAREAKKAVMDVLYDLSTLCFALKMTAAKKDQCQGFLLDEILEVLDKKRTEVQVMPTAYLGKDGFSGYATPANNSYSSTNAGSYANIKNVRSVVMHSPTTGVSSSTMKGRNAKTIFCKKPKMTHQKRKIKQLRNIRNIQKKLEKRKNEREKMKGEAKPPLSFFFIGVSHVKSHVKTFNKYIRQNCWTF